MDFDKEIIKNKNVIFALIHKAQKVFKKEKYEYFDLKIEIQKINDLYFRLCIIDEYDKKIIWEEEFPY